MINKSNVVDTRGIWYRGKYMHKNALIKFDTDRQKCAMITSIISHTLTPYVGIYPDEQSYKDDTYIRVNRKIVVKVVSTLGKVHELSEFKVL